MLLSAVVAASDRLAATRSRKEKTAIVAELLREARDDELAALVGLVLGAPRQGRIGVGWASLRDLGGTWSDTHDAYPAQVGDGTALTVADVDRAADELAATTGAGSSAGREARLRGLWERAAGAERSYLGRWFIGEVRHGALEGVVTDAIALANGVPVADVRRAALLVGDLGDTALLARHGRLIDVALVVGRGVLPMLAASATDVREPVRAYGTSSVEWKLDGARIQVHRSGDRVWIFTRNLNEITGRLPEVEGVVRSFASDDFVLDGEVLLIGHDGTPHAFQDTMSLVGAEHDRVDSGASPRTHVRAYFFDVIADRGADLTALALRERQEVLNAICGPDHVIPRLITDDPEAAAAFADDTIARGHEGVVVKDLAAAYDAGRRGSAWTKVKPVRTLDLVVLAAEWGHGRRTGSLSNLHLGARDPSNGAFVMVGKTFKGLTDALLAWQTEALLAREVRRTGITVWVRPELVVEIALDGVQRSVRYPGGVALRFARVRGYRPDREASSADTIATVQAMLPG